MIRLPECTVGVHLEDGAVRASYSVMGFGPSLAWIGMILVDPDYRGKGLGSAAFDRALGAAKAAGFNTLGLDATTLGEPIYRKSGFQVVGPIVRWTGVLACKAGPSEDSTPGYGWNNQILDFDAAATGVNRAQLLVDLSNSGATILSSSSGTALEAYAVIRPGRTAFQLGPVLANSDAAFAGIIREAARFLDGRPVCCDLFRDSDGGLLHNLDLQAGRALKRMTFPHREGVLCDPTVRCGAGFEWG